MAHRSPQGFPTGRTTFEVLDRVAAARTICDAALLGGQWLDATVLDGVSDLVRAAARWAEVAEVAPWR